MPDMIFIDKIKVEQIIANKPEFVKNIVLEALKTHYKKQLVLPLKQYLQRDNNAHPSDRIISMSVYLSDPHNIAGIKWIGSNQENFKSGVNRASALIILMTYLLMPQLR
jgi:N-[(2S)-2-amino-2-carboxyethyl]-L-glutamate dehydrogenase